MISVGELNEMYDMIMEASIDTKWRVREQVILTMMSYLLNVRP